MFSEKNSLVKSLPGYPRFINKEGIMGRMGGKEGERNKGGRERKDLNNDNTLRYISEVP